MFPSTRTLVLRRPDPRLLAVGLLVLAAACGTSEPTGRADSSSAPVASAAPTAPATVAGGPAGTSASAAGGTAPAAATVAAAELPGEPFELGFLRAGDRLGVMGVAHDDVLNVRALPGADQPVVATLAPLADDVTPTGRLRRLPDESSIWAEITRGAGVGWVNASYLAYLGAADDWTSQVVEANGGRAPSAATMEALGDAVVATFAHPDPAEGTRSVQVTGATVGDLGEVTYDVVGLLDDAQIGLRLHVFGTPQAGGGFTLASVEAVGLCSRGVTDTGACV